MELLVAAGATAICLLSALFALRSRPDSPKRKPCGCTCACGGESMGSVKVVPGKEREREREREAAPAAIERQVGASIMEQLVPEIRTHALSYLDYPSLCRLSMTNSSMRRAANDDNAWKALYRKDFTVEQDSVTPPNGWKSYYAATKAVINVNTEFYNIIREKSLPAMSHFWLQADYVKCIHGTGELFSGYAAVMACWSIIFNWGQVGQGVVFEIRDVRARVLSDMAWVTMNAYIEDSGPFHVTNIYEFHNGRWYMVHHHSSVILVDGDPGQQNVFG